MDPAFSDHLLEEGRCNAAVKHCEVGKRAEVLLFANGLALNVLQSRTNGYKDIETSWAGNLGYKVGRYFHYDGTRYKLVREHTSKLQSQ